MKEIIKPSHTKDYDKLPLFCVLSIPESMTHIPKTDFCWYFSSDGCWHPHRKPTTEEITNNKFN